MPPGAALREAAMTHTHTHTHTHTQGTCLSKTAGTLLANKCINTLLRDHLYCWHRALTLLTSVNTAHCIQQQHAAAFVPHGKRKTVHGAAEQRKKSRAEPSRVEQSSTAQVMAVTHATSTTTSLSGGASAMTGRKEAALCSCKGRGVGDWEEQASQTGTARTR